MKAGCQVRHQLVAVSLSPPEIFSLPLINPKPKESCPEPKLLLARTSRVGGGRDSFGEFPRAEGKNSRSFLLPFPATHLFEV